MPNLIEHDGEDLRNRRFLDRKAAPAGACALCSYSRIASFEREYFLRPRFGGLWRSTQLNSMVSAKLLIGDQ
jgi:hypothetical protein